MSVLRSRLFTFLLFSLALVFSGASALAFTPVELLGGKLSMELEDGFVPDKSRIGQKAIAAFKAKKGDAWGAVTRGSRGLEPTELGEYLSRKAAEYSKGLSWLPQLTWLKKETVTVRGRVWADLRFIAQLDGAKGPLDGLFYTRVLATSYEGQLLEIVFTSNTDRDAKTKARIDRMMDSVKLAD